jgi:hypothetical protein
MYQVDQVRYRLLKEIESGRSHLILDSDGSLLRTVSVVVLELLDVTNDGERVLVQVWDSGTDDAVRYRLPGHKVMEGESPRASLDRLLATKVGLMLDGVELDREEKKTLVKKSETFDCKTQYDRYIYYAHLKPEMPSKLSRICKDQEDRLVYEVCSDGGRDFLPLVSESEGCPLDEQVQCLQENSDVVTDDTSGCELFCFPHSQDAGRIAVFSWMEPTQLDQLGEGYTAQPDPVDFRRRSRRKSESDGCLTRPLALDLNSDDEESDSNQQDQQGPGFGHSLTQTPKLGKASRRFSRSSTAPNMVKSTPTNSTDFQQFKAATSKRNSVMG